MPPTQNYQERAAKWRRTNPADETRGSPGITAKSSSPPWPQWTRTAHPRNDCSNQYCRHPSPPSSSCYPTSPVLPDSVGCSSVPPMTDSSTEVQPDIDTSSAVQGTMQRMLQHVIGPQENASTSKNTFLSEAIPLSNIMPEKVKNQVWANEFIDFSLLLKSNISNTMIISIPSNLKQKRGGSV